MKKTTLDRQGLIALYEELYKIPSYRMMPKRLAILTSLLREWLGPADAISCESPWSYLDVSCGRGESLDAALTTPFSVITGTEAIWDLVATKRNVLHAVLPEGLGQFKAESYHVVSCIDVLEHILREDWEPSVKELARVCSSRLILCISNVKDGYGRLVGHPLHVTRLPYAEIDGLLREWAPEFDWGWRSGEEGDDAVWWVGDRR